MCNGYSHGYFFRDSRKTQEKQGFLNGMISSCKTVIHQFKSGRHLQGFPIKKWSEILLFHPFKVKKGSFWPLFCRGVVSRSKRKVRQFSIKIQETSFACAAKEVSCCTQAFPPGGRCPRSGRMRGRPTGAPSDAARAICPPFPLYTSAKSASFPYCV